MLLCLVMILCFIPACVQADMGPKPSVSLQIEGTGSEVYYVTLLSKDESTGPYSVRTDEMREDSYLVSADHKQEDLASWRAFRDYTDPDGFYFIEYFSRCNEENSFRWGYYPPDTFKVLVYFPQSGTFVSSGIYERYAFHSYYEVAFSAADGILTVQKNYDYTAEILSLIARIVATIAIEILVALLFGLKTKKTLAFIAVVNVITQVVLNILLNIIHYSYGGFVFVLNYIWMELLIIILEAVVYTAYFKKLPDAERVKRWVAPAYAVTANVLSFAAGMLIANLIPGIF